MSLEIMDRFMLHLKNTGFAPSDTTKLLADARSLAAGFDATIRDCRVATKYVEFDVSIDKSHMNSLVEKLKPIADIDHARQVIEEHLEKNEAVKLGVFYFNEERFWEAHEVLEGVWKKCFEGERDLVQGIILVAAAFVHYQKDETSICLSVLGRALDKLANATGTYHNINIDLLRNNIKSIISSGNISLFSI
ncbi:DUF309 domain-containing protein [Candidatus Nitrosotenuis uzonensis]|uniref:DUF309 domain-containing protein n=1 Tax=Candidatus Nitrosotenuis uzonensis TaxID=1407055 RepID=UPI00064EEBF2|nr:DUF309 domain-containing protein [Candidatus Nitrosotenuis uzonensis]